MIIIVITVNASLTRLNGWKYCYQLVHTVHYEVNRSTFNKYYLKVYLLCLIQLLNNVIYYYNRIILRIIIIIIIIIINYIIYNIMDLLIS